MKKYQLIPETVEATRFVIEPLRIGGAGTDSPRMPTPLDLKTAPVLFHDLKLKYDALGYHLQIPPGEGGRRVDPGDWLVVRPNGRREAYTDAEFRRKFQELESSDHIDSQHNQCGSHPRTHAGGANGSQASLGTGTEAGPANHPGSEAREARSGAGVGILVAA